VLSPALGGQRDGPESVEHANGNAGYESGVRSFDYVARFAEHGVRAHTVESKPGRWLVFRSWPTGRLIRAKIVKQRGYAGHHVVRRALDATEAAFPEIAQPALEHWTRGR